MIAEIRGQQHGMGWFAQREAPVHRQLPDQGYNRIRDALNMHHGGANKRAGGSGEGEGLESWGPLHYSSVTMLNPELIKELAARLSGALPRAEAVNAEVRTRMEQVLRKGLDELNLLSREEFESTAQALQRAEQRIAELEQALAAIEQQLQSKTQSPSSPN